MQFAQTNSIEFESRCVEMALLKQQAMNAMDKTLTAKLSSARVHLVDDDPYMRKDVRQMLPGLGVRAVHEAEDGPSGLAMSRTDGPNVLILDWAMPGLNGTEF